MSDSELLILSRQRSELTDAARQALANEISQRGLKAPAQEAPAPPPPEPSPDSSYAEERELVELCTVWSLRDALQLQALLDTAGIPFFMGPEKATGVDTVSTSFLNGVGVQVMRVGLPWAQRAMRNYTPADEPAPSHYEEPGDLSVHCPKCGSEEVVFERLSGGTTAEDSPANYEWTCDACGHQWADDGIAKEE